MRFPDLVQLSWTSLRQNKLRSSLTVVGVTVGVFALTTIIAIGNGLEAAIVDQLTDDESQTRIVIRPGFGPREKRSAKIEGVKDPAKIDRLKKSITKRRRGAPASMMRRLLTVEALQEIREREHVTLVRPLAIDRFKVTLGEGDEAQELDGALSFGVMPDDPQWNERVIHGDPLTAHPRGVWVHEYTLYTWGFRSDAEQATVVGRKMIIGRPRESNSFSTMLATARANGVDIPVTDEQARAMFKAFAGRMNQGVGVDVSETGELTVEVTIRGVIRERIESDGFALWEDSFSMISDLFFPQPMAEELFQQVPSNLTRGYNAAAVEVDEPQHVKSVEKKLRDEGYRTVSVDTILSRVSRAMAIITSVVSGLTAIALIVAILGIVNTMIMNVSERTREIGVLKALGATDGDIRGLFLVESGLIGLGGGVSGVLLSLLASIPGDYLTQQAILEATQYGYDGTIFDFQPGLIILAMSFAVILSVLAALGPATRASRVDPTVALRDE